MLFWPVIFVTTAVGSAMVALILLSLLQPAGPRRPRLSDPVGPEIEETTFLFDNRSLIDATAPARALLESLPPASGDWERLLSFLRPRFPRFDQELQDLARAGRLELSATGNDPLRLRLENVAGLARLTLVDPRAEGPATRMDALSLRAMEDELTELREVVDELPLLCWRGDATEALVWANRAYLLRAAELSAPADPAPAAEPPLAAEDDHDPRDGAAPDGEMPRDLWPPPQLFATASISPDRLTRLQIAGAAGPASGWFQCSRHPTPDGGFLCFAVPVDALVGAERALKDFIQTLTRTFAQLPTALAIFDHDRRLALFNPAVTDLTGLSPQFLAERPTLGSVLDRLREEHMLPEPRNYRSWHRQMTEIERAAAQGFYQDTWQIPSGETYRVTARPHTDGGLAMMIEDITGEITLTRRFRGEIDLGRAVIDQMPEAVAVFSPSGGLVLANAAYDALWGEAGTAPGARDADGALTLWQDRGLPGVLWTDLSERLSGDGPRQPWAAPMPLRDGRRLAVRTVPLTGGMTMVGFGDRAAAGPLAMAASGEAAIPGLAEEPAPALKPPGPRGAGRGNH
ncbi:PAS-domain containing protein [Frigidibacter sp. MR17.24]|uniref:PAS-domain containing protein n=1 Tax=Frigidibacter sp. MR17.24 TaxID=3127345 RepID=UPI003012A8CD